MNLPEGIISIGDSAFNFCTILTDVNLPNSLVSIGDFAFQSCSNLENINLGSELTSIGTKAFDRTKVIFQGVGPLKYLTSAP